MKTKLFTLSFILLATLVSHAQDIAVQTPTNTTVIYHDINLALYNAPAGSTIFLPVGFFAASDTIKIRKQLTIIGVGHRSETVGGNSQIIGNLWFLGGADNSSLMGVYMSGNLNIADATGPVNNFILKFCNINSTSIGNLNCKSVLINQNYIRWGISGGNSSASILNNILYSVVDLIGGNISNNIITGWSQYYNIYYFLRIKNSIVNNNFLIQIHDPYSPNSGIGFCYDCSAEISNNAGYNSGGNNFLSITVPWNEIFVNSDLTVNPLNDFHLKSNIGKNAGTDGTDIGIYGGTGFSDAALPPYPQITFKNIPGQTDEYGNLKIQVKVRAQ